MHERPCESEQTASSRTGEELVAGVADQFGENTRVGAIEASCEFTQAMLPALAKVVDHPDMTEELAEILITRAVDVECEISTGVSVRDA